MCKPVLLLPSISQTLIDGLNRKASRGDFVSPVWPRLIRRELSRCAKAVESLFQKERESVCRLLDWYISNYGDDDAPEIWFELYRPDERDLRTSAALLNWYSQHLDGLSHFERKVLIDMAENYLAATGKFRDDWKVIYSF